MLTYLCLFSVGFSPAISNLIHKGLQKTHMAFRPSTQRNYNSMFRLFILFTVFMCIQLVDISPLIIIAYLEFLYTNKYSASAISNHLLVVKTKLALMGLPTHPFDDPRIKYFQKAIVLHRPFKATLKKVIDIDTLQLSYLYINLLFIFRISNLVPHNRKSYSPLYHLSRADVFFAPPGMHVLLKWLKTLQSKDTVKLIKIPSLGANPICPVMAIKNLPSITPGSKKAPLFQFKISQGWLPLTDTQVRCHFKMILNRLQLQDSNLTYHAFRCSGATYAFNANIALQDIHSYGTWTSECVWKYITMDHNASDQVARAFQCKLHSTTYLGFGASSFP